MEKPDLVQNSGQSPDLAAAVLAQSQALTALVSQISSVSSDPMGDLAGSSLGTSTKGAVGRANFRQSLRSREARSTPQCCNLWPGG